LPSADEGEPFVKRVSLPQLAWYETGLLDLVFPESWEVELCHMAGHNRPALDAARIEAAILRPIGTSPISVGAEERKK